MAKPGKNKKRCEKYRNSGRKEENKRIKQEKHQRRLDYFARRRMAGGKIVNKSSGITAGEERQSNITKKEMISKKPDNQLPLSWWTGVIRKTQNYLDKGSQLAKKKTGDYRKRSHKIIEDDDE